MNNLQSIDTRRPATHEDLVEVFLAIAELEYPQSETSPHPVFARARRVVAEKNATTFARILAEIQTRRLTADTGSQA